LSERKIKNRRHTPHTDTDTDTDTHTRKMMASTLRTKIIETVERTTKSTVGAVNANKMPATRTANHASI
jgi:hypothetical protein